MTMIKTRVLKSVHKHHHAQRTNTMHVSCETSAGVCACARSMLIVVSQQQLQLTVPATGSRASSRFDRQSIGKAVGSVAVSIGEAVGSVAESQLAGHSSR